MNETRLIPGLHAVREAILHRRVEIKELWVKEGRRGRRTEEMLLMAEKLRIPVKTKKGLFLDDAVQDVPHQGIVAVGTGFAYVDLERIIDLTSKDSHPSLIVAADHVTDEGNLGALIRTAEFFGVQGLILPKDRSAKVTDKVMKRSSGAYVHLPVARVVNLSRTLDNMKKKGFWIVGATGEGEATVYQFDWVRDLVLVMGSEGTGLTHTVKSRCHQLVGIPSLGSIASLNVSVAAGVILSEVVRQRNAKS